MQVFAFPLARISVLFAFGIALGHFSQPARTTIAIALLGCFLSGLAGFCFKRYSIASLSLYACFLLLGCMGMQRADDTLEETHFTLHSLNDAEPLLVELVEKQKGNARYERFIAQLHRAGKKRLSGKLLLQIPRDSTANPLTGGQFIIAFGRIDPPAPALNPEQFDYGAYLRLKNVYGQMTLRPGHYKITTHANEAIYHYTDRIRNHIVSTLAGQGFNPRELSVLNALILGQQQDIAKDIVRDYQYAGAVHILSVSGLHVGILLLLLDSLFGKALGLPPRSRVKLSFILFSLWAFAMLAGGAPSIIRAVAMFSFVAIGLHLRRQSCIFHTLLVSMFGILLFKPQFLFDIGFQLSYLALFFIVWLQPQLAKLFRPRFKIARYFWDILTVSTAAQLGTLPLNLYYFHQFPGLFFVTNLVILPCLGALMTAGILAVLWTAAGNVPDWLIWANETGIRWLNEFIAWVASAETFVWHNIPFDKTGVALIYAALICFGFWIRTMRFRPLAGMLMALVMFQGYSLWEYVQTAQSREFLVLHQYKTPAIVSRDGTQVSVFADSLSADRRRYLIEPYQTARRVSSVRMHKPANFHAFGNKRILHLNAAVTLPDLRADVLLLSNGAKINLERIIVRHRPKIIVADGSNYRYQVDLWRTTCQKQKIPFHATAEKGFYALEQR